MAHYTNFGIRMKQYEAVSKTKLVKRIPVAIRVDGKAFHTFCKGLKRPYDNLFNEAMNTTMLNMAKNIQNCIFAYRQSDEITFILTDYETLLTDAWFDYEVQKLCSVTASMATMYFNKEFCRLAEEEIWTWASSLTPQSVELQQEVHKYHDTLRNCIQRGAMFDARAFNIPKEEVTNLIYWRQQDAIRNSINSCGQYYFSHKQLQGKNCAQILEMLKTKGINWETAPACYQRGVCCYKSEDGWKLDLNMPILKGEDREYLERLI